MVPKVSQMHQKVVLACFEVVSASHWVLGKAGQPAPFGQCMGPVGQFLENFRFLQKYTKRPQMISNVPIRSQKVVFGCLEVHGGRGFALCFVSPVGGLKNIGFSKLHCFPVVSCNIAVNIYVSGVQSGAMSNKHPPGRKIFFRVFKHLLT